MTAADFKNELKKGTALTGTYLFYGEEEYLKRFYLGGLKRAVVPDEASETFNYICLSGNDEIVSKLRGSLMALPMFAEKKLVVLDELDGKALSASGLSEITDCISLTSENEYDYNVVLIYTRPELFDAGTEKAPSKLMKALCGTNIAGNARASAAGLSKSRSGAGSTAKGASKKTRGDGSASENEKSAAQGCAVPVEFQHETPIRLSKWAEKHFAAAGVAVSSDVCDKLVSRAGRDMNTLSREIEKLCEYAKAAFEERSAADKDAVSSDENSENSGAKAKISGYSPDAVPSITGAELEKIVPQNREINAFDFANAILDGNMDTAFYIMSDMKRRRERPEIIMSSVMRVYLDLYLVKLLFDSGMAQKDIAQKLKMHEYKLSLYLKRAVRLDIGFLKRALDLCSAADMRIKRSSLDSYVVIENLMSELNVSR